ncbi:hypothetical protein NQ314_000658 [Rhamnusium bicolor]|uniref:DDE Tnp4 domain-containing protein n=1 Tax=Rhamnusium bicolor TaxID=1586634 RepID=A0AAV8ZTV7_9CUCU|nr:hypothetical protein NQ314_000658 [Rhamnusium bicolor]
MNPVEANFHLNFIQALENAQNQRRRRLGYRHIRDASNPFEMADRKFVKLFRLNKEAARDLIEEIKDFIEEPQRRDTVPLHLQVFICLNFLGHGGYQTTVGQELNLAVSQPVVSRILKNICNILTIHLLPRHVRFPTTDEHVRRVKDRFTEKFNFPDVIGVVDGTHVPIVTPTIDDPNYPAVAYLNRKGYYSINVQATFDADMILLNVNARYPGATHDSAIWEVSTINRHLRRRYLEGQRNTWLLGDSGYPLQPWLMTPITDAAPNSPEAHYTKCHVRARNVGERGNGTWKERFRCLKKTESYIINMQQQAELFTPALCCTTYVDFIMYLILKIAVTKMMKMTIMTTKEMQVTYFIKFICDVNILEEGRLVRRRLVEILWNRAENRIG